MHIYRLKFYIRHIFYIAIKQLCVVKNLFLLDKIIMSWNKFIINQGFLTLIILFWENKCTSI